MLHNKRLAPFFRLAILCTFVSLALLSCGGGGSPSERAVPAVTLHRHLLRPANADGGERGCRGSCGRSSR